MFDTLKRITDHEIFAVLGLIKVSTCSSYFKSVTVATITGSFQILLSLFSNNHHASCGKSFINRKTVPVV
jgi:hypothetical protein